jgi:hypothetical protein
MFSILRSTSCTADLPPVTTIPSVPARACVSPIRSLVRVARDRRWYIAVALSFAAMQVLPAQDAAAALVVQRHGVRLDSAEAAAVERGDVVVRTLPTRETRDVAVLGVVRVETSRDLYLRRVQDFRTWLRTPTRTRLGVFSDPARPEDVEQVQVTKQDARDLRKCKPGECSTKLPATVMQQLQDEINWSSADAQAQISALARRRMLAFVGEYRDHGNASMPVYDDRPSIRASDAFSAVLAQSTYLLQAAPALASYLGTFPRGRPAGVSDVLYWSEDAVQRLRPIISVTHAVVYTPPELSGTTLIASKQIYANHYFEAALEALSVIDGVTVPSIYLVVERRYRFDNLPGGILNIRGRAIEGLRAQLRDDLRRERASTERR